MLSRVADSLYWMSRYLERAEHTARLLDVNLNQMLDQSPATAGRRWERLLSSLRVEIALDRGGDPQPLIQALTFDAGRLESIVACVAAARENARQVREQISSEMWEQLNRLYLQLRRTSTDEVWRGEPHEFFRSVKEGAHLFQGITDATLSHGEGWHFIQVGRYLERATATAALLDSHFSAAAAARAQGSELDSLDWVGLLKSCTAFEAYCKVHTADVQPERALEFLLLSADFPRSVRFSASQVQRALHAIGSVTGARGATRVDRPAGRLRAALDYGQADEIMDDIRPYLENIQRQCALIHTAVYQVYISYPADVAIAS
ncbi:MAG: hypothetical protein RLZZ387_4136 [Chloroflexota bacterium]|jgi:uncharacterized alpha-E superfamily protein